jgi:hypothetical protein
VRSAEETVVERMGKKYGGRRGRRYGHKTHEQKEGTGEE